LVFSLGLAVGVVPGSAPTIVALAPLGVVAGSVALMALIAATARSRWMAGTASWKRNARAILAVVPVGIGELPWFARRPARVGVASLVPAVRREGREAIGRADLGGLGSAPAPKAVTEIRPTAADPWPSTR